MSHIVDFKNVSTAGLESSPVAETLAGLRANEARYFMNKYKHEFTVVPASESQEALDYVNHILKKERDLEIAAKPLETSRFQVENIQFTYVFYEDGLALNVMYTVDDPKKRAVGFKLSEGMEVPEVLEGKFKFARQKSKLAGTVRGSFFVIKREYSYEEESK
ncbi:phage tail protein [Paenibacillus ihbetae]|uniref:Phage tail protein n=1 Tax=Paenibacillus ihbetae TaxID=1870820 RepID=A0ABX3JNY4_9BACL|nr:phage tail protein [Paenibacillus ihbetae]OOC58544.1 phage tail protein [Paenibacillus ihbetae]